MDYCVIVRRPFNFDMTILDISICNLCQDDTYIYPYSGDVTENYMFGKHTLLNKMSDYKYPPLLSLIVTYSWVSISGWRSASQNSCVALLQCDFTLGNTCYLLSLVLILWLLFWLLCLLYIPMVITTISVLPLTLDHSLLGDSLDLQWMDGLQLQFIQSVNIQCFPVTFLWYPYLNPSYILLFGTISVVLPLFVAKSPCLLGGSRHCVAKSLGTLTPGTAPTSSGAPGTRVEALGRVMEGALEVLWKWKQQTWRFDYGFNKVWSIKK